MSIPQADTPMMRQFNAIKREHPDKLLFYRMGDFYEMFGDDAIVGAKVLQIALTSRNKNKSLPMCGVPYHAAAGYLERLVKSGTKVAICEQVEDPSAAKGIVKRSITRIVTPGTILDEVTLEKNQNNFKIFRKIFDTN